ncbi:UDP-glycosyltransferase 13-like [Tasmannia lanceolata]|uniref:UDP-glycosyltransferase 13-like n=1 Tax=Tasmannia lanceolata TaxID=3420 RepID=UPI00406418BE
MSNSGDKTPPHVALLPSSGMGHLTPFLRLAATLAGRGVTVTLITICPTVSAAESHHLSQFLSSLPQIHPLEFQIQPLDPTTTTSNDPFFLHFEAISRSAHLLTPLLSSSSFSALVTDISLASAFSPIASNLNLPNHILFTSSASMLAFCAYFSTQFSTITTTTTTATINLPDVFDIPGLPPLPKSSIPPPLLDPAHLFTTQFIKNGLAVLKSTSIIINTFDEFEPYSLTTMNEGKLDSGMPQVFAIGPLDQCEFEKGTPLSWLDLHPDESVVYVSFGSRTALSEEQIKELGVGLEKSGCRFLWVVKSKVVDREEEVEELERIIGEGFIGRNKEKGLVVMDWVDQGKILGHKSVGGFVSHCGWNSMTEAAWYGVPVLAWPQAGDQRINAGVVGRGGLGIWMEKWGWKGEEKGVVKGEEIGEIVRKFMGNLDLKVGAKRVREGARKAVESGGSSDKGLREVVEMWKRG